MSGHRVAITGAGLATPLGHTRDELRAALLEGRTGVVATDAWDDIGGLDAKLVAPVVDVDLKRWPRKRVRSMGRVARLALHACEAAVADSGVDADAFRSGRGGLAYGSTHGSSAAWEKMARSWLLDNDMRGGGSSVYLQFMAHTCAANLALYFEITGRVIPTNAACASGSMAIGLAYEAIRSGAQDVMLAGGAEELHPTHVAVFDAMYAASLSHTREDVGPRPFDVTRDGLVVGEGAGAVVLERWDHAVSRGATILGEVRGYGMSCDGTHVTAPSADGMRTAMRLALDDAGLTAADLDYVNAHATATQVGDVAESHATLRELGDEVPISSTKGFTGHTLGACGAIETVLCLDAMAHGYMPHNRGLTDPDPACAALDYVMGEPRRAALRTVMNNNFAFGGINTSLVLGAP